jgi:hypothetical protein
VFGICKRGGGGSGNGDGGNGDGGNGDDGGGGCDDSLLACDLYPLWDATWGTKSFCDRHEMRLESIG